MASVGRAEEDEGRFPMGQGLPVPAPAAFASRVAYWALSGNLAMTLSPNPLAFSAQTETHSPGVEAPPMGGPRSSFSPAS